MAIQKDGLILGGRRIDRYKKRISYIRKIVARPYMTFAWLERIDKTPVATDLSIPAVGRKRSL
jgi:hypothetical protein